MAKVHVCMLQKFDILIVLAVVVQKKDFSDQSDKDTCNIFLISDFSCTTIRGDQIFFSATCPGQVACKNPLVLRNFLLVPKYFSNRKSIGQVANTTISLPLNQSCR